MVKFLQTVLSIPTMQDISLNILTKKQREKIATFLEECKAILPGQEEDVSINKVINLIRKWLSDVCEYISIWDHFIEVLEVSSISSSMLGWGSSDFWCSIQFDTWIGSELLGGTFRGK